MAEVIGYYRKFNESFPPSKVEFIYDLIDPLFKRNILIPNAMINNDRVWVMNTSYPGALCIDEKIDSMYSQVAPAVNHRESPPFSHGQIKATQK